MGEMQVPVMLQVVMLDVNTNRTPPIACSPILVAYSYYTCSYCTLMDIYLPSTPISLACLCRYVPLNPPHDTGTVPMISETTGPGISGGVEGE